MVTSLGGRAWRPRSHDRRRAVEPTIRLRRLNPARLVTMRRTSFRLPRRDLAACRRRRRAGDVRGLRAERGKHTARGRRRRGARRPADQRRERHAVPACGSCGSMPIVRDRVGGAHASRRGQPCDRRVVRATVRFSASRPVSRSSAPAVRRCASRRDGRRPSPSLPSLSSPLHDPQGVRAMPRFDSSGLLIVTPARGGPGAPRRSRVAPARRPVRRVAVRRGRRDARAGRLAIARAEKPDAHAAYIAALDREAHAAAVLEHRVRASGDGRSSRGSDVQLRP